MTTSSSAQQLVASVPTNCNGSAQSGATQLPHSSAVVGIAELAEKYALLVPFRINVLSAHIGGNSKDPAIMVDNIYSVHLVKQMEVVTMKSADGEYTVPLNSTAKVGLIHNEHNECMAFETVEELLSAKLRPKVIAVKNKYISPDGKVSLKKNEVLIVRDVIRAKIGRNKIALKFFSVLLQKEIVLQKEHDVQFTTNPHSTQLYLMDLVEYLTSNFMPCSARFFFESSITGLLSSTSITLQGRETHQSVIVSRFHDNPKSDRMNSMDFIEIPTNINICVGIIETSKDDRAYHQVMEESRNLLQNYSHTKMRVCVDAENDDVRVTQTQMFAETRQEKGKQNLAKFAPQHYLEFFDETKMEPCDDVVSVSPSVTKHQVSFREGVATIIITSKMFP